MTDFAPVLNAVSSTNHSLRYLPYNIISCIVQSSCNYVYMLQVCCMYSVQCICMQYMCMCRYVECVHICRESVVQLLKYIPETSEVIGMLNRGVQ